MTYHSSYFRILKFFNQGMHEISKNMNDKIILREFFLATLLNGLDFDFL